MDSTEEQLRQLVVPLFAVTGDAQWHPVGTAFVVAARGRHALLVTAGHNLDYFRHLVSPVRGEHPSIPRFFAAPARSKVVLDGPELLAVVRKRGQMDIAVLSHGSCVEGLDVALLTVSLPEDTACSFERAFSLESTPVVPIGCPVYAIGYSGLTASSEQDWDARLFRAVADEGSLVWRPGKVLSNVEAGGANRFTGIYVSSAFDSGMSGGPVVELRDGEPLVRALVTSDLSEDPANPAAGSGARAFASSIWMLAGLRANGINLERADGTLDVDPLVRDLIATGKIRDLGEAHRYVQVEEEGDGDERRVRSLRWVSPGVGPNEPPSRP